MENTAWWRGYLLDSGIATREIEPSGLRFVDRLAAQPVPLQTS